MKISRLTVYPVKSMSGNDLAATKVESLGLDGDRRWAVVYPSGKAATRRELPPLAQLSAVTTPEGISLSFGGDRLDVPTPSGAPTTAKIFSSQATGVEDAGNYASHFLSSALEHEVRLVYFPATAQRSLDPVFAPGGHHVAFADGFPILLTTQASLNELNADAGYEFEMRRFRSNIVVDGDFSPWEEDKWRLLRIGSAILRIVKPCERCIMTTQDPVSGEKTHGNEPLATLARLHRASNGKIIFGQNAIVEQQGSIVLGDEVEVLESGPSNLI